LRPIDRAFKLRLRQDPEAARELYLKQRMSLGLGRAQIVPDEALVEQKDDATLADIVDVVLLGGSLARMQGKRDKWLAALAWAEVLVQRLDLGESFYLLLELGLRAHVAGDFERALQAYGRARGAAKHPWQQSVAAMNSLIAMEHLGIDAAETLRELNALEEALAPGDLIPGVASQLVVYNWRAAWRKGDVAAAAALPDGAAGEVHQAHYLALWAKSLPFTTAFAAADDRTLERLLAPGQQVFQRDYRLRTLRGVLHPDDLADFTPYDAADRAYAWVWRWLAQPERFPVYDAVRVLESLAPQRRAGNFTCDDRLMVGNAMLWLGLFGYEPRRTLDLGLSRLEREGSRRAHTALCFERAMLDWFYAVRDGDAPAEGEALATMRSHPLWASEDILWPSLVRGDAGVEKGPLAGLRQALLGLRRDAQSAPAALTVNVLQSSVAVRGEVPTVSPPMVRALCLLREKEVVTCDELLRACFGLGPYNPVIHERKIFNLLSRLKALPLGELQLKVKSGFVVATASPEASESAWNGVRFLGAGPHAAQLALSDAWRELLAAGAPAPAATRPEAQPRGASKRLRAGAISARSVYTRTQIERLSGRPRSTVGRWLNELVAAGLVKRTGKARSTSYQILEPERFVEHVNGRTP